MKYIIYSVGAMVLSLSFASCSNSPVKAETEEKTMAMMPDLFETFVLEKTNPKVQIEIPGELLPDQQVSIYAKVSSYVNRLHVDIGSVVKKGDLLLTLEAPEITAQLASARSKWKAQEAIYIATKANFERMNRANLTEGAISNDALDQITARYEADAAQLAAAKSAYDEIKVMEGYLQIHAPFSGVVSSRNVDLGAYVGPAGKGSDLPLFVIQDHSKLRLSVSVPEANTPYVNFGDTVLFTIKSLPHRKYMGTVVRKTGALDAKLRSERIEADIINIDQELMPLMVTQTQISLKGKESTFFIPKSALVESAMGVYIIQVVDGKAQKVKVSKGRVMDKQLEVFGEIEPGNEVLLKANEEIAEGTKIG